MIKLIVGVKGSGKTKLLISMVNGAVEESLGNVVCIEASKTMTFDIHYHVRLIVADEYEVSSYDAMRGFISG
ncbi:MAG: hypothetical protein J6V01_08755, partial [Clostridia bacterium]|nr:hypothetical protein [Clostridia bacterium]